MSEWVALGGTDRWQPGEEGGRVFRHGGHRVAVFRHGGSWFALDNRCPHERFGLAGGDIVGDAVRCPGHGWAFGLADGRAVSGPKGLGVATYPVRERDGQIEVRLP